MEIHSSSILTMILTHSHVEAGKEATILQMTFKNWITGITIVAFWYLYFSEM